MCFLKLAIIPQVMNFLKNKYFFKKNCLYKKLPLALTVMVWFLLFISLLFSPLQVSWKKLNRTSQACVMNSLKKNHRTQKTWQNSSENLGRNCASNQNRNKLTDNRNFFLTRNSKLAVRWKPYQLSLIFLPKCSWHFYSRFQKQIQPRGALLYV